MRVLQVINNLATGGAEKLLLETLPIYKEKGLKVDLLVFDGKEYPYMEELKQLNCCSVFSIGNVSLYNPWHIFKIIPYLKKYDLVHVHLFPAQYWVVFAKIISFSKIKLVFTEHSTSNRRIQNAGFKYIERLVYHFYDKIICISNEVKQVFIYYTKFTEDKFKVIQNGVNLKSVYDAKALVKLSLHSSLRESDQLIIQVAGFRIEKDQKTVIRAMQYLNENVKLLLVGDGKLIHESQQLVNELGLSKRVLFLGVRTDVPSLLKTAEVSIVSSHWEGFGLVAVESMAAGKPVIASNVQGLANVVEGAGLLFEKGNEKELAAKIEGLLNDKNYYDTIVQRGFERSKKYNIDTLVQRQIALYEELLKEVK